MSAMAPNTFFLQENGAIPNNPELPVVIYRKALGTDIADKSKKFQQCFVQSGWKGVWKNGLYDYHHFHSSSHEALAIANGTAEVELGGEHGKRLTLEAGDVIVLPAGTGHRCVQASANIVVMGAYPEGQENYDICRHKNAADNTIAATIAAVSLPNSDPIYGANGPLMQLWRKHGDDDLKPTST